MRRTHAIVLMTLLCSCSTGNRPEGYADRPRWAPPPVERLISIRDGRTDERLTFEAFIADLARSDVVFLGENHNDETTHRVELAVYQALLERRRGQVVLAMEMFERDVQPHLDAYIAGEIDEPAFLAQARPWGNYRTGYRYLVERARAGGHPVVGSNFPRPLVRRIAMEGPEVLQTLEGDERDWAPAELHPNTPEYWRRVDNAIRSHRGMFGGGSGDDDQRLYSTQTLWDNAMGEACVRALDAHRGSMVLHVNGGFHSAYWDGTVHQLKLRRPKARIRTVAITPVDHPGAAVVDGKPEADYVVFAEARSSDRDQGLWAVRSGRDIKYRIHRPDAHAAPGPHPLLIWLGDDGLTARDGIDLWRARLGDDAVIVALAPPYRAIQPDLSAGGRWYWPDSFSQDLGAAHGAIHGAWSYVVRHYDIDPARVCLAGEGTGATVVTSVTLNTASIDHTGIAIRPRQFAKLKDLPLPLPDYRGPGPAPEKSLRVFLASEDEAWWSSELDEYRSVGLSVDMRPIGDDPWTVDTSFEDAIRDALGLSPTAPPANDNRLYVLVDSDAPRARHWARLLAAHSRDQGSPTAVVDSAPADGVAVSTRINPADFTGPAVLPTCPGPFGGTTIVVLAEDASADQLEGWRGVEANDPLNKKSRFHRLRVATAGASGDLAAIIEDLLANNRKNVLIIPATFYADIATMQTLRRSVRDFENRMTIHWMPGLGGRLNRIDN